MKAEYRVVAIDDTEHWNLPDLPESSKMLSVFLYDKNSYTHCCEIFPSYECHKIYSVIDDEALNESQYEILMDLVDYNDNVGDISYFHCSNIDKLKSHEVKGDFKDIKEAIEYARGNHLI